MKHTALCPRCGREVAIPDGLPSCFCTYCGAEVPRPADTPPAPQPGDSAPFDPQPMASALSALVSGDSAMAQQFDKAHYENQFRTHQQRLAPLVRQLEESLSPLPGQRRVQLELTAAAFLDELSRGWKKPTQPKYVEQFLLSAYTIPALRDLPQRAGDELARAVQAAWVERWHKFPIGLGDYETISSGFRKKLCFITTAVCRRQGKGDDCYELTAFRRFRDQVLLPTAEGARLVEEYYRLAPGIVTAIALCREEAVYDRVYTDYLIPCLRCLEAGDEAGCRDTYQAMVEALRSRYLPG